MYELSVRGHFAASHLLKGYEGKCKNLHGHTWRVELVVESQKLDAIGMVADFAVVRKHLNDFLERLDHVHLNEIPPFNQINPTTEILAKYIFDEFAKEHRPLKV